MDIFLGLPSVVDFMTILAMAMEKGETKLGSRR
jgi:hypothetical protein